jgi:hypothetical protein
VPIIQAFAHAQLPVRAFGVDAADQTRNHPPMPTRHTAAANECVASIAFDTGHFWQTIWDHPDNAALREARSNPWILREGDVLLIPELRRKELSVAIDTTHKFRRKGVPEQLRLRFGSPEFPRRDVPYTLIIDHQSHEGVLDENGQLSHFLMPNATRAELTLRPDDGPPERYVLGLRGLEPIDTLRGVQMRLRNLQLYHAEVDGALGPDTVAAMRAFQVSAQIELTDNPDDATRSALVEAHGC